MNISNQWQRYTLGYANGYTKVDDPTYNINTAYPDLKQYYGILAGLAFTSSFAICGIFGGVLSDKVNRSVTIGIACICWSACTLLTGLILNFYALFAFRFLLGAF